MKRLILVLTVLATLTSANGFAAPRGSAAADSRSTASNDFAWGIGLGGLAILATVVGLTAASASSSPSTFSH